MLSGECKHTDFQRYEKSSQGVKTMSHLPPLLYRGSVKNVRGLVSAPELLFEFSDRYSVFDWGEMPDELEGKGIALAQMGRAFFSYLENPKNWKDLSTSQVLHEKFSKEYLDKIFGSKIFQEYCEKGVNHHALLESSDAGPFLKVKNVAVLRPPLKDGKYQYKVYQDKPLNALVPLEIIFRMGLPPGNSLSKRLGKDLTKWRAFGFKEIPEEGEFLATPFIDFSTKLEKGDRYLPYEEAQTIAGLNNTEWTTLLEMAGLVALNLYHFHKKLGLELWDGKIEVAFSDKALNNRSFMLVDSIGIDELRLLYEGKSFSKEFLREVYKKTPWYEFLEVSKKEAAHGAEDFKAICLGKYHSGPEALPKEVKDKAESVYKSYCNTVVQEMGLAAPFPTEFSLKKHTEKYL
jgi:phosphoribosylaminoimidazole-succinocarboxamide synthase